MAAIRAAQIVFNNCCSVRWRAAIPISTNRETMLTALTVVKATFSAATALKETYGRQNARIAPIPAGTAKWFSAIRFPAFADRIDRCAEQQENGGAARGDPKERGG